MKMMKFLKCHLKCHFKFSQCSLSSTANNSGQSRYSKYVVLLLNRARHQSGKDGLEFNKCHLATGHPIQVSTTLCGAHSIVIWTFMSQT